MAGFTPLPASIRMRQPAVLLATWFGAGLIRPAPGTWGTLAAVPFALFIHWLGGSLLLFASAIVIFTIGIWAAGTYCRAAEREDASEVVIDEVAAIWLVLAALPLTAPGWLAGFLLFRLFDILKPWPIRGFERRFKGGIGVMIDDIVAALFAILTFILFDIAWTYLS
jgi:phosphatidylglycerophosphatase A